MTDHLGGSPRLEAGASSSCDLGGSPPCDAALFGVERDDVRSRADVEVLVRDFYRDVAMDDLLGPVFARAGVDWSVHVPKLVDFWAGQLLGQPGYEGNPWRAHESVHTRTPLGDEHYARWLELFEATLDASFAGPTAESARRRARSMARALRRLLDGEWSAGSAATVVTLVRPPER